MNPEYVLVIMYVISVGSGRDRDREGAKKEVRRDDFFA